MPDAKEIAGLRITQAGCAKESESCAVIVSCHDLSELGVLNAEGSSGVLRFCPVQAAIMRHGDLGMSVRIYVAKINCVVLTRRNRGITAGADGGAIRNGANHPGQAIVSRNGNAGTAVTGSILTIFIRDVGRAIRRNANVPMQAAASSRSHRKINSVHGSKGVNRNSRSKRDPAIIAAGAERSDDILRAVINCVWIR